MTGATATRIGGNPVAAASRTGTVRRVTDLLSTLADADGPVSVRHVAERLALAPSTTHRLLNLLVDGGFVTYQAGTSSYAVGPELYRIGARVTATVSPAAVARDAIAELARRWDETVLFALVLESAGKLTFVERADGQKRLRYQVEMNVPLSLVWGASGKAALAYLPAAEVRAILAAEGASATGDAPPSPEALAAELARIREQGFCVSHGEKLPGALGIAAPVFGPRGVMGTICMTMPSDRAPRLPHDALGAEVARTARALSDRLGTPREESTAREGAR